MIKLQARLWVPAKGAPIINHNSCNLTLDQINALVDAIRNGTIEGTVSMTGKTEEGYRLYFQTNRADYLAKLDDQGNINGHGGKRERAGRKPLDPDIRKVKQSLSLDPMVVDMLRADPRGMSAAANEILSKHYFGGREG